MFTTLKNTYDDSTVQNILIATENTPNSLETMIYKLYTTAKYTITKISYVMITRTLETQHLLNNVYTQYNSGITTLFTQVFLTMTSLTDYASRIKCKILTALESKLLQQILR